MTNKHLPNEFENAPTWLVFSHNFQVPWILMSEFAVKTEIIDSYSFNVLVRQKTKWWAKTEIARSDVHAVKKFFQDYPQFSKTTTRTRKKFNFKLGSSSY